MNANPIRLTASKLLTEIALGETGRGDVVGLIEACPDKRRVRIWLIEGDYAVKTVRLYNTGTAGRGCWREELYSEKVEDLVYGENHYAEPLECLLQMVINNKKLLYSLMPNVHPSRCNRYHKELRSA